MHRLSVSACLVFAGLIGSSGSFAQPLEKPVCMENPGGARSCLYDTFAQCQQATTSRSVGTTCVANPTQFGTTGQGGMGPTPRPNNLPPPR